MDRALDEVLRIYRRAKAIHVSTSSAEGGVADLLDTYSKKVAVLSLDLYTSLIEGMKEDWKEE